LVLVKSVEIDIGVKGDRESKTKLDDITKRAETLKKAFPEYKLKIDAAAASERLKVFRAQLADATKPRTAEVKVKVDDSALSKFAAKMKGAGGPAWLGPALLLAPAAASLGGVAAGAAAGLGGAFAAGGAALAAFGAVAKPVLADAMKASQAVEKAQKAYNVAIASGVTPAKAFKAEQLATAKAYAGMSPAQIALSKQLGTMASAWDKVKTAQTPVIAGALQPWLRSVTDLTGKLGPIIAKVAPVVRSLGTQFGSLVNSSAFRGFRDFIGSTGAAAVSAGGSTMIDLVKSFMILLPKADPLIREAVGWIGRLGPAVLAWSSSKKASDDIQKFLQWFARNGPAVGGFLKNIGGALKALAPGLASGGVAELNILSGFFGFIAKLPPGLAKPLGEVAGALLLLNKLGVVKAGVQLTGWTFGKGASAAGGEAAAGAEGAAAGGLMSKLTPGLKWAVKGGLLVAGAKIALSIAASQAPTAAPQDATHFKTSTPGAVKRFLGFFFGGDVNTANVSAYLHHLFGAAANWGPQEVFDLVRHKIAVQWDGIRHDIAHYWGMTWSNTIGRAERGFHDIAHWFDTGRHWIAGSWGQTQHETVHAWDVTWNNTIGRAQRGMHDLAGWFDTGRHWVAARWAGMGRDLLAGWQWITRNVFSPLGNFVTRTVPGWFGSAVGSIGRFWSGLGAAVRKPVAWVVDNVLDGLISVFDTITGAIGLKGMNIKQVHPFGLAAGGRIPGFGGGDRWPALLEGGEAVVDKRTTAAHAADLRAWGVPGFAKGGKIGQNPPAVNLHTGVGTAGPSGAPGFIGKIVDAGKMALAFATGNSAAFSNAFSALLGRGTGGAGGIMGRILTQIPKEIAGKLVGWIMGKSGGGASGSAIADYAMSWLGKIPYVWGGTSVPGGADCSGFTQAVYRHAGISAPRTSEAQGAWVRRSGPVPGGLAFYHSPAGGPDPGHVAIVRSALQVISQGGGMGPQLMGLHAMPLLWTGVPPGGLGGGGGGATGGTMSSAAIAALWRSQGGPGFAAANMARIAFAESGDRPGAVQQGQPFGLTGMGLYQITPTSGITQNGAFGNLLNAANNTRAAISLFSQSGYGPWASDPVGAGLLGGGGRRIFDTGYGVLPPGLSLSYNGTGRPEMLQPARGGARGGGATYIINVHASPLARPADIGREVVGAIKAYEKGSGKGWRS
jgi:NlpC/P60 family protein